MAMIEAGPLRLQQVGEQAVALSRLYGRGPSFHTIDATRWRFQWQGLTRPFVGVEMRLRVGSGDVVLGLEDLGPFGAARDVLRPEMPAALRAAYVNGLGEPAWRELEALTGCAVEVVDVTDGVELGSAESVGFVLRREPSGPMTRGFARLSPELMRTLPEAPASNLPKHIPLGWAVVLGCTTLTTLELRGLEEHDIVLVEDVKRTAKGMGCRLAVGPTRRYVGRAV